MGGEEGFKSTQKEAKRAPRDTEEQPRAPEVRPRERPRPPKRKPSEPSRAPMRFLSKEPEITEVKIVLPPRRGASFDKIADRAREPNIDPQNRAQDDPQRLPDVKTCCSKAEFCFLLNFNNFIDF